jgi:predicted SAM-dependent methyltransferase
VTIFQKFLTLYKAKGVKSLSLFLVRRMFNYKPRSLSLLLTIVSKGRGIEIGGPSSIFSNEGIFPIYAHAEFLDNCNFQSNTLWNSDLQEGQFFNYHSSQKSGHQFIHDSVDLSLIKSNSYDFLLSSHVLEHIANPIKALEEWKRILTSKGYLILILPCKEGNFDHKRSDTTLEHLMDDFLKGTKEDDLTHLEEILRLHDLSRDSWAGSFENFKSRAIDNVNNRSLHHHVFNQTTLSNLMVYLHMNVVKITTIDLTHIVVIAQKNPKTSSGDAQ